MKASATSLFISRFPRYTFALSTWKSLSQTEAPSKPKPLPLDQADILYLFGLESKTALQLIPWLKENSKRRAIFLEPCTGKIASFLQEDSACSILQQEQIEIYHLPKRKEKQALLLELSRRYPKKEIAICYCHGDKQTFSRTKLSLFRNTGISSICLIERLNTPALLSHLKQNVQALASSFCVESLKDAFVNIPAIICGAGPSLECAIEQLQALQNRALIIAGGSAIAALSARGIEPHFCIASDPNPQEFDHLKNNTSFHSPLLFSLRMNPSCHAAFNGPLGYIRTSLSGTLPCRLERECGMSPPLIGKHLPIDSFSVTLIAAALAYHFGCNPILFEGIDLAYTDNRRYAEGIRATDASLSQQPFDQTIQTLSRKKKKVKSAVRWLLEAKAISKFAKRCKERRWIQCSFDSLHLKGIESLPLSEAATSFPEERDLFGRVHQAISSAPQMKDLSKRLLFTLEEWKESLQRLLKHLDTRIENKPGLSALAEIEMQEEPTYHLILCHMTLAVAKLLEDEEPLNYWKRLRELTVQCVNALE